MNLKATSLLLCHHPDPDRLFADHAKPTKDVEIVHLDEELALEKIECKPEEMVMLLQMKSSEAAQRLHEKLSSSPSLLTGGVEWACRLPTGEHAAILRRVVKTALRGTTVMVHTSVASHQVQLSCCWSPALTPANTVFTGLLQSPASVLQHHQAASTSGGQEGAPAAARDSLRSWADQALLGQFLRRHLGRGGKGTQLFSQHRTTAPSLTSLTSASSLAKILAKLWRPW